MNFSKVRPLLIAATIVTLGWATAQGEFVVVEDFDGLVLNPIDGQAGWTAPAVTSAVVIDPADATNQVLSVVTESTHLHRGLVLTNGTTRMLFLRFRFDEQLAVSFGMSVYNYPSQFGDFEVELSLTNAGGELRINDDGNYQDLVLLESSVWYNCWCLIDNTDDVVSVWLHDRAGEGATTADRLSVGDQTTFGFRGEPAGDLRTFFIKTGGGSGINGPLYLDDIHLESTATVNLSNPSATLTGWHESIPGAAALAASPNPFNPRTTVRFALPAARHAVVAVYDARGMEVARLVNESLPAGPHTVDWDGRDAYGAAMPSGTYFCRLTTFWGVETRKLQLVR